MVFHRLALLNFTLTNPRLADWFDDPLAIRVEGVRPKRIIVNEFVSFCKHPQKSGTKQKDLPGYLRHRLLAIHRGHMIQLNLFILITRFIRIALGGLGLISLGLAWAPAWSAEPVRIGVLAVRPQAQTLAQWQARAVALARLQFVHVISTGMPPDKGVHAVLTGRAVIGFVRTGVLEAMERAGLLDLKEIKVLHRQSLPDFPAQSSTLLYPEWPFSCLAHTDGKLARGVTAALFLLNENTATTRAMGIRGFAAPGDSTPVADLLGALRLPPFEAAPVFTLNDVLTRYGLHMLGALLVMGLILSLGGRLLMTRRRLTEQYRLVLLQKKRLRESEFRWKFAIEGSGDGLWDWNVTDGTVFFSPQYKQMLGLRDFEMDNEVQEWEARIHPDDKAASMTALQAYLHGQIPVYATQYRMRCKDGSYKWILDRGRVVSRSDAGKPLRVIGTHTDISAHKQVEEKLQLAASVFTHALEGIMITDAQGVIIDVNEAFSRITGYERDEVLGRNPHLLSSGRQGQEFYAAMWRDLQEIGYWCSEVWNRRKNGEVYAQLQNISAVRDAQGQIRQYVSLFSDITALKQHQQQLQHMAHFDALTDLPNRLLLADRLRQGMAQAQRRGQVLALAFLDLDGFKFINDSHGHEAGDHLLLTLATRMKQSLREGDTLARLGGDEFVAVILDLADVAACEPMLRRLLAAAAQPVQFGEHLLQVSASLGVTFYPQGQELDADQLLRQADQAMYQAKLAGKNRYQFFGAE